MWHKGVFNSDAWHPELVDEIIKYLKNKWHITKINSNLWVSP
jgi:hypothetical protein